MHKLINRDRPTMTVGQGRQAYCFTDDERDDIYFQLTHRITTVKDLAEEYRVSRSVIYRVFRQATAL